MREHKFRAWDKTNKIMIHPNGCWFVSFDGDVYFDCDEFSEVYLRKEDVILYEYTGMKDIIGVDIYEGDIVSHRKINGEIVSGVVKIETSRGVVVGCEPISFDVEIIGNIH